MKRLLFLIIFFVLFLPLLVFAHPGNTDSYGCHTCRTNCESWGLSYGEYHCHSNISIPCTPPYYSGCVSEQDYTAIEMTGVRSGMNRYASQTLQGQLNKCREEIEENKISKQTYEDCLDNQKELERKQSEQDYELMKADYQQQLESIKEKQRQLCVELHGSGAFYDYELKKCSCTTGYLLKENICITHNEDCQKNFGLNSYTTKNDESLCACKDNYEWNENKTLCVKKCPENSYRNSGACVCLEDGAKFNYLLNKCVKMVVYKEDDHTSTTVKILKEEKVKVLPNNKIKIIKNGDLKQFVTTTIINTTSSGYLSVKDGTKEQMQNITVEQTKRVNTFQGVSVFLKKVFIKLKFW